MKTKYGIYDFNNKIAYQDVLANLILTNFNKEIKYDYTIPPICSVLKVVSDSLEQWNEKSQIKEDIFEIIKENCSSNSIFSNSIFKDVLWDEEIFGHERFCRTDDFFRYRREKKAEAISKIYSHPKLADREESNNCIKQTLKKEVEEFVKILNKNIEEFYKKFEKEKNESKFNIF